MARRPAATPEPPPDPPPLKFVDELRTIVVLATGPSLTAEDVDWCRGWPCIAVNDAWKLAPWADALYACDFRWWEHHVDAVAASGFAGQLWTYRWPQRLRPTIRMVAGEHGGGLSTKPGFVRFGANGGHQAMHLAFNWGARRIVCLGLDGGPAAGRSHFFGDHPKTLYRAPPIAEWHAAFDVLAKDLRAKEVEVINCSPLTNLKCWPVRSVREVLVRA